MTNIYERDLTESSMIIWQVYVEGIMEHPNLSEFFKFIDTTRELEGIDEARYFVLDQLGGRMSKMWDDMDEVPRLYIGSFDTVYFYYWLAFVFPSLLKEKGCDKTYFS